MSKLAEQARSDANNNKTGNPPAGLSAQDQATYRQIFQDQKAKNDANKK